MPINLDPIDLSPTDFEKFVKEMLEGAAGPLEAFQAEHLEPVRGTDGNYTIDVTARFEALGGAFLVLIECKKHKDPIKREVVQVLHSKMQSTGAQKGMVWATTTFQSGAIEYATTHGIALVQVVDGKTIYFAKSEGAQPEDYAPFGAPAHAAYVISCRDKSHVYATLHHGLLDPLREFLEAT